MAKPKPKYKMVQTGFRLTELKKSACEQEAKERKISLQQLIEDALDFYLDIPAGLIESCETNLVPLLRLPVGTILSRQIIKYSAFEFSWFEVFGKAPGGVNREFVFKDGRLLGGDDLLDMLNEHYLKTLRDMRKKMVASSATGKAMKISTEQISTLAAGL